MELKTNTMSRTWEKHSVICLESDRSNALHFDHAIWLLFVHDSDDKVWWVVAYVNVSSPQLLYVVVNFNSVLINSILCKSLLCLANEFLIRRIWGEKSFGVWSICQIISQVCIFQ